MLVNTVASVITGVSGYSVLDYVYITGQKRYYFDAEFGGLGR